jgi:hypothetical protein
MSTTEIEPRVNPGAPLVRDPDVLPPGTDPHEWPVAARLGRKAPASLPRRPLVLTT